MSCNIPLINKEKNIYIYIYIFIFDVTACVKDTKYQVVLSLMSGACEFV